MGKLAERISPASQKNLYLELEVRKINADIFKSQLHVYLFILCILTANRITIIFEFSNP